MNKYTMSNGNILFMAEMADYPTACFEQTKALSKLLLKLTWPKLTNFTNIISFRVNHVSCRKRTNAC